MAGSLWTDLKPPLYWLHLIYTTWTWSIEQLWTLNHVWNVIVNVYEWWMHKFLFLGRSSAHFKQEYIFGSVSEIFFISHVAFRFQDSFTLMPISEREKHFQGMQKKTKHGWAYLIYSYSHLYKIDHIISVTWGLLQGRQKGYNNWMREVNSWPAR